ncbi:hypothetical protein RS3R2_13050 [Pseudomonas lactis]|nr:hypothetical protein RS3R2_13050 [Pseudomonas lactis]
MNQRRLKEIQQSIDDESPISKEQARKIRREALENQLKYEAEIDSKTSENIRLKELVAELQMSLNTDAETRSSDGQRADDVVENNPDIKNIKSSESESSAELSHEQYSKTERLNNRFKDLFSSVSSFHGFSQPRSVNELPLGENDKYYSAVHTLVKQLMNSGESDDTIREQLLGVGVSSQMINRVYSGINNKGGRG